MSSLLDLLNDSVSGKISIFTGGLTLAAVVVVAANAFSALKRVRNIVEPYDIAVIGLPRSGKTTLITSMFQVIFFQRFLADRVAPRGSETIDRVNQNLETLQLGRALGPTTEQDMFAYRADYSASRGFFRRTYRLAIGDFAGEYTDKLADDQQYKAIYDTTFFKWVMEADAFIFVLDVAAYMRDGGDYVARVASEFRSIWQRLVEYHLQGEKNIRNKKVAIVINKSDLIVRKAIADNAQIQADGEVAELWRLGFGTSLAPTITLSLPEEMEINRMALEFFQSVVKYFELQSSSTKVIPVSSFALAFSDGAPLGVKSLINFILPGR